jgi:branched-chain amino acid transport system substrate-binding protein
LEQWLPSGDPRNTAYVQGYVEAILLAHVLRACGDDLTRENVLRQATAFNEFKLPLLLPGITVSTAPDDYHLFKQFWLGRFNGKSWIPFGELIQERGNIQ